MSAYFGAYGITYRIAGQSILNEISFEMKQGEVLALLGPNGAGKSTLLKVLAGILRSETGSQIRVRHEEVSRLTPDARARLITYVGADLRAEFPVTALETVMMGRFCHDPGFRKRTSKEDQEEVRLAMEACSCWNLRDREIGTLSGGERQLVALARSLAQGSKLVLLDESLSRMDLHHQARIARVIREIAAKGKCFILVSHDVNLAAEISDTAILLNDGRLAAQGRVADVLTEEHFKRTYPGAEISVGKNPLSGAPQLFFNTRG